MKQLLIIILAVCLVIVSGCSSKTNLNESSVSESAGYTETRQEETDTSQTETSTAGQSPTTTEGSEDTTTKESVSTETKPPDTESKAENDKKEPQQTVSQPTAETETNLKETESSAEKPKEESKVENKTEDTSSSAPPEPEIPKATAADAKAIAAKTVEYINAYRAEQGVSAATVLPGLTEYAEYRSRQLVSNFAHDTADERAAATALEYGKYIDPVLYGATGEPYYTANAREAIVKAGYSGSIDTVAKNIAQLTRNSSGHWSYVGDEKYSYIAIGITYESGYWYCDIAMTRENTYN